MKIQPIDNTKFGIYKKTVFTTYGHKNFGEYKGKNITIYYDTERNVKMFYVTDAMRNWIKSKLIYIQDGVKKTIWSKAK